MRGARRLDHLELSGLQSRQAQGVSTDRWPRTLSRLALGDLWSGRDLSVLQNVTHLDLGGLKEFALVDQWPNLQYLTMAGPGDVDWVG